MRVVTVELGGRPYQMRLTLYAQMLFETERGKTIAQMDGSATDMATLLWACMREDAPDLTVDEVARLIDIESMEGVTKAIDALTVSAPLADGTSGSPSESSSLDSPPPTSGD